MKHNPYKIVEMFEEEVAEYTGSPYAIALDNCTDALFLCCVYSKVTEVTIPKKTYLSVPQSIMSSGGKVVFDDTEWRGVYELKPYKIYDSARRFTSDMYIPGTHMCVSFTGPYKHLKLGKGGAILTDNFEAYKWFKRARYSGRNEMSYHDDYLDMLGWNFYMMPEIASRGLLLMNQFYNMDGTPKHNEDLELPYPDLSKFDVYKK